MPGLTPITTTNSNIRTWADMNVQPGQTYCYYVQAVDSKGKASNPSNIAKAIIPIPENEIFISAELNKKSYGKNDTVIMKVKLTNAGQVDCTDQKLVLSLPVGLAYSTNDRVDARIEGNGDVVFDIGFLQRSSSYTLSIHLIVEENVSREHSLKAILNAYCGTTFQNSRDVSILLKPSKNQNQGLDSSIRLGGTRQNPETGRSTIDQSQPLDFTMTINGGEAPYTVRIDWGDGSNLFQLDDVAYGQEIKEQHNFERNGQVRPLHDRINLDHTFLRIENKHLQISVRADKQRFSADRRGLCRRNEIHDRERLSDVDIAGTVDKNLDISRLVDGRRNHRRIVRIELHDGPVQHRFAL